MSSAAPAHEPQNGRARLGLGHGLGATPTPALEAGDGSNWSARRRSTRTYGLFVRQHRDTVAPATCAPRTARRMRRRLVQFAQAAESTGGKLALVLCHGHAHAPWERVLRERYGVRLSDRHAPFFVDRSVAADPDYVCNLHCAASVRRFAAEAERLGVRFDAVVFLGVNTLLTLSRELWTQLAPALRDGVRVCGSGLGARGSPLAAVAADFIRVQIPGQHPVVQARGSPLAAVAADFIRVQIPGQHPVVQAGLDGSPRHPSRRDSASRV